MDTNRVASLIAKNNTGEQQAISDYFELIADTTPGMPKAFYDDIREIISDEMNHSQKLAHWVSKITDVQPATH